MVAPEEVVQAAVVPPSQRMSSIPERLVDRIQLLVVVDLRFGVELLDWCWDTCSRQGQML